MSGPISKEGKAYQDCMSGWGARLARTQQEMQCQSDHPQGARDYREWQRDNGEDQVYNFLTAPDWENRLETVGEVLGGGLGAVGGFLVGQSTPAMPLDDVFYLGAGAVAAEKVGGKAGASVGRRIDDALERNK